MNIKRAGDTIYELDGFGINKWSFNIQAAYAKDGNLQPQSVIDKVATLMENAENLRVALTAAMNIVGDTSCPVPEYDPQWGAYVELMDSGVEELLNKLK